MAIKAGQILHDVNGYVINRIQSAGPGNINIPEEKVYELGNFESVCTVRDIPDLSFDMESLATSTEVEALLTNLDPDLTVDGQEFDLRDAQPVDVLSPFKSATNQFDIVNGVIVPHLTLERASYRFGLRQNASQQFTLRGDSIYYVPGTPYKEVIANAGDTTYNFATTPTILYNESGDSYYAYNVTLKNSASNSFKRLFLGSDFTNTATGFTLLNDESGEYDEIHVVYGSTTPATYPTTVHKDATVQPCAIRGKDIDVYVGDGAATQSLVRWSGVQSFETTWSVSLENDEEFGNSKFVSTDFDVPEVSGSIGLKPLDAAELFQRISNVANVPSNETAGALTTQPLPVEVRLSDPDTGDVVKTFYIPDARFTVPSISGRVQSKLETTFNFSSDSGGLLIYEGSR
jgi:hypothetical protein